MTPYFKDKTKYARVTEVVGAGDCEATSFIENDNKLRKSPRSSHTVTLPGTLTHSKIEVNELQMMGKKSSGLKMEKSSKRLFSKVFGQHKKDLIKNPKAQTAYMELLDKVNDCYANYLAFVIDFPHKPLLIEKKMYSGHHRYGGTVDLVGLFKVKGYSIKISPDPDRLAKKAYWKHCDHKGKCGCVDKEVACVLDWKTSVRSQKGHKIQMSAYFCMLEELGHLDKYRRAGYHVCWETWSVLLGVHSLKKTKTPYQIHLYDPHLADFLVRWGVHQNAGYITRNLKGKVGLKGRCMFCSHIMSCPDRLMWNLGGEMEFPTFFTRPEMAVINLVTKNMKGEKFRDLKDKIVLYLSTTREIDDEIVANMTEVLNDFQKKLDISIAEET